MAVDEKLKVGDESWVFGKGCIAVEVVSNIVFEGGDVGIAFGGITARPFIVMAERALGIGK